MEKTDLLHARAYGEVPPLGYDRMQQEKANKAGRYDGKASFLS